MNHIYRSRNRNGKKENWIKSLIEKNIHKEIKIISLEECELGKLNEREIFWINKFRKEFDLTNISDGGKYSSPVYDDNNINTMIGRHLSVEAKAKISKANSGINNGMYGKKFILTPEQIEKARINMINSKKFQESRKSKEFRDKISDIVSIPVVVLNEKLENIMEFKNTTKCSEYFGYTRGNIKHAVRDLRQIGKGKKEKYWIVRKEKLEESIEIIKIKNHKL
jgi:group I intron endonuclease